MASPWCGRPAITLPLTVAWASVCSTTSPSPAPTPCRGRRRTVPIVDCDVHHGNGTQDAFFEDVACSSSAPTPRRSTPAPATGGRRATGKARRGDRPTCPSRLASATAATPPPSTQVLAPLARSFQPQLILVSAGYDAHWNDPLASMQLSIDGYAALVHRLLALAGELCQGRIVFTLEGGYHLEVLALHAVLNTLRQLSGQSDALDDPLGPCPWDERDAARCSPRCSQAHGLSPRCQSQIVLCCPRRAMLQ